MLTDTVMEPPEGRAEGRSTADTLLRPWVLLELRVMEDSWG
jgi:hypothetical protein